MKVRNYIGGDVLPLSAKTRARSVIRLNRLVNTVNIIAIAVFAFKRHEQCYNCGKKVGNQGATYADFTISRYMH